MAADLEWLDTLRSRGFGRRIAASAKEVDSQSAGITFTTSGTVLGLLCEAHPCCRASTGQVLMRMGLYMQAAPDASNGNHVH